MHHQIEVNFLIKSSTAFTFTDCKYNLLCNRIPMEKPHFNYSLFLALVHNPGFECYQSICNLDNKRSGSKRVYQGYLNSLCLLCYTGKNVKPLTLLLYYLPLGADSGAGWSGVRGARPTSMDMSEGRCCCLSRGRASEARFPPAPGPGPPALNSGDEFYVLLALFIKLHFLYS